MKKKKQSLLVVDLSTSSKTSGSRIVPLIDYFSHHHYQLTLLMNLATQKHYDRLLGSLREKIKIKTFPFSDNFSTDKILVGLEYLKRILASPFLSISEEVDIIYSLTGIICDVFPSFVFKSKTKKIWVANVDNIEAPPSQKPGLYLVNLFSFLLFRFSVFLLRWADVIFITTPLKEVRDALINGGVNPEKIILSNNGIPLNCIQRITKPKTPKYSAVFMGRLHQGKGVFDLVKVWRQVLDKFPQAGKLVLIGAGDKETTDKLKNLIKENKLTDQIFLAGFVDEKTKYQLLKSSQLFLYPSYYDANPISTVEALACGLPIVAYNLPIFIEHYPKDIIEVVAKGEVARFAQRTISLLTDQAKIKKMATAGVKWAQKSSWEEIFKRQEKVIEDLLK